MASLLAHHALTTCTPQESLTMHIEALHLSLLPHHLHTHTTLTPPQFSTLVDKITLTTHDTVAMAFFTANLTLLDATDIYKLSHHPIVLN